MNLGENIYRLRTQKNMSQGDLADALEVSRQSVSKWENNSATPELDKLIKMSELFGVTIDQLAGVAPFAESPDSPSPSVPPHRRIAVILLACAFLTFLAISISKNPLVALMLSAPFLICCLTFCFCKRNIGIWCIWSIYLYLTFLPLNIIMEAYGIYFPNAADAYAQYSLTVQLLTILGTVLLVYRRPIILQKRTKILLTFGWFVWLLYFIGRVISYIQCLTDSSLAFAFGLRYDPGFPLFVLLIAVTARILYQRRKNYEPR